ncbi:alpha/beta fold hydrolase [Hydrogenophaga sp. PBL-H3]|uniref:alpha/beta fold hydrolase n=1 Tax=Hydrogenophaga sp. PBL-H3 TaxID=434010 RepID=UPI00131F9D46|nr:alpha/beta hydrolase [Hydrogenophaga sp. PBL-H3]QHE77084.1 alpha/beta hydrolase [Hydrogenophaga sp. PBL-H3]QHE81508.1 alpha/beta hydrolase [Hydrogenophaga sp. PBL-H3]
MNRIVISGVALEVAHIPGPIDKAPLVFLHEGLGSVSLWQQRGRHWPAELCAATGREGWLYSRRGYGQSDPVEDVRGLPRRSGPWHIGRHEPDYMHLEANEVLPQLLQRLGIARPVLVGHSDGATIALLHAARHDLTGCVAIAPHVFVEAMSLTAIAQAKTLYEAEPQSENGLRQRLARHHRDVDNAFWQWNDVWLSEAFHAFDIRDDIRSITAPLLLVQGVDDEYGTMEQLKSIETAIPRAIKVELAQCGHSPHRDQPDRLTEAVQGFLSHLI